MPKYGGKTNTNQKGSGKDLCESGARTTWPKIFAWILWNFLTRFVDTVSGKKILENVLLCSPRDFNLK